MALSTCAARSPSARPWWYVPEHKSCTESRRLAVTCFRALTCSPVIPATHMACTPSNPRSVSTRYVPAPALMNQTSINKAQRRPLARGSHMRPRDDLLCRQSGRLLACLRNRSFHEQLLSFFLPFVADLRSNTVFRFFSDGGARRRSKNGLLKSLRALAASRFTNRFSKRIANINE